MYGHINQSISKVGLFTPSAEAPFSHGEKFLRYEKNLAILSRGNAHNQYIYQD